MSRAVRADARRNHDQLVATAAELFAQRDLDVPLEEIARCAHVGIGTLYRHFPTRDALTEAVYRREVEVICDSAADLLRQHPADEALARWMRSFAGYIARKRGMAGALKAFLGPDAEVFTQSLTRIRTAIAMLVAAAVADGTIRSDVDPGDLLRAMGGICMATDSADWADRTAPLVDLLMDGLRYGAPRPR